jgi:molybdate transport system ATP-binding protein
VLEADVELRSADLDLSVRLSVGKETLLVVGPNGAGKTTLLRILLGIQAPTRGRISLDGQPLLDTKSDLNVPPERRGIGYVPQDYALFPHLDVAGNVGFGLFRRDRHERVPEVLSQLGIAHLSRRRVQGLSGGERQKVALARALAPHPRALLLDEPFAALDVQARRQFRGQLAETLSSWRLPALIISHDPADAVVGSRIVVLERGRIAQEGTLEQLRARPATAYVQELASG